MPLIAILDRNSVLQGFEHVPVHTKDTARRIRVPDDCDLAPRRYVWRQDKARFVPIDDPEELGRYDHMLDGMGTDRSVLWTN